MRRSPEHLDELGIAGEVDDHLAGLDSSPQRSCRDPRGGTRGMVALALAGWQRRERAENGPLEERPVLVGPDEPAADAVDGHERPRGGGRPRASGSPGAGGW